MTNGELIDGQVSENQCKLAVNALLTHALKVEEKKAENELLLGKEQNVWLVLTVKQMQPERKLKPYKIPIMHPLVDPRTSSVCLITKDPQREYKDLLEKHSIRFISRVVGISKLKGKFKPYEARRMLLKENDLFLADDRVIPLLPGLLGKKFFQAKKQPIPVSLTRKDLKDELERAISSTYFHQNQGTCTSVKIGTLLQKPSQVLDNLKTALPAIVKHIKGKWDNIQSFHIKTNSSTSLPIWSCHLGAEEGARWAGLVMDDIPEDESEIEENTEGRADEGSEVQVIASNAARAKGKKNAEADRAVAKPKEQKGKGKKRVAEEDADKPKKKAKASPILGSIGSGSASAVQPPAINASAKKSKKSKAVSAVSHAPHPTLDISVDAETLNDAAKEKQSPALTENTAPAKKLKRKKAGASPSDVQTAAESVALPSDAAPLTLSVAEKKNTRASAVDFFEDDPSQAAVLAPITTDVQSFSSTTKKKREVKQTEADSSAGRTDDPAVSVKVSIEAAEAVSTKPKKRKAKPADAQPKATSLLAPTPSTTPSKSELKRKRTVEGAAKKREKVLQSTPAAKSAKRAIVGKKRF
ncbi:ribosomal protein L1 [Laetiporus sulphureus 93-53]|uniref:Ribosomal protein L1 n=1 Tax=Laetiporus sulphureus 93-53 TaxID=1314785 RepID=A0A165HJ47_9APHY|nr:ribosomal protein L1 [Laetiporus sulphureus 93-53]KZT11794.1 ribosomal protein L1 [Laetiporus sulphureus 93-53]